MSGCLGLTCRDQRKFQRGYLGVPSWKVDMSIPNTVIGAKAWR